VGGWETLTKNGCSLTRGARGQKEADLHIFQLESGPLSSAETPSYLGRRIDGELGAYFPIRKAIDGEIDGDGRFF
jgi:hypothetical protein